MFIVSKIDKIGFDNEEEGEMSIDDEVGLVDEDFCMNESDL